MANPESRPSPLRLAAGALSCLLAGAAAADEPGIIGDLDGDRVIPMPDLLALRQSLDGMLTLPASALARADVNHDRVVDEADYTALIFPALSGDAGAPFQTDPLPQITAVTPSHAPPGALVHVAGSGFGPDAASSSVRIGETVAELVSAGPDGLTFVAPAGAAGRLFVTNHATGLTSAGRSFIVTSDDLPAFDPDLPHGEVLIGMPASIPLPNAWFTVPIAVNLEQGAIGSIGVMMHFDPTHVQAIEVVPTAPDYLAPMPPCIDNASGLLGSGALRKSFAIAPILGDSPGGGGAATVSLFSVVFKCVAYRHEAPRITARVESLADDAYPATPIGATMPHFAATTAPAFPPTTEHPLGVLLAETPLDETPVITAVSDKCPDKKGALPLQLVLGGDGATTAVWSFFNQVPCEPLAITSVNVITKVPPSARSGIVMVLDAARGVFSNDVPFVKPETSAPALAAFSPAIDDGPQPPDTPFLAVFDEVLSNLSVVDRGVRMTVTTPDGHTREVGFAANLTPYLDSAMQLRPVLPFPNGSTVVVSFQDTIRDMSGNALPTTTYSVLISP